jgi:hypothetical protein
VPVGVPDPEMRRRNWLAVFAGLSVGGALTVRWWHRGHYYNGWEVLGAAQGLFLVSTNSAGELLRNYRDQQFNGSQGWNVYGLPITLLPGWLTSLVPWGYWAHLTTMAIVALSLWLLGRALRLSRGQWWLLLLCWGSSPALLSYTVTGFPYISSILPYAVALWAVFRWQSSVIGTLLLSLLAIELGWQVQELGRTVFLVFAAAAVLLPGLRWRIRIVWLAVAGLQYWLATTYLNFTTANFSSMRLPPLADLPAHLVVFARYLFVEHGPDLPVLLTCALIATLAARRERWFWGALLGVHLGLLFLLATNKGTLQGLVAVWPRRALLLQFVCMGTIVSALGDGRSLRPLLLGLLVAGNAWQLTDTLRWASHDLDVEHRGAFYALPFVQTPINTGGVVLDSVVYQPWTGGGRYDNRWSRARSFSSPTTCPRTTRMPPTRRGSSTASTSSWDTTGSWRTSGCSATRTCAGTSCRSVRSTSSLPSWRISTPTRSSASGSITRMMRKSGRVPRSIGRSYSRCSTR